MKLRHRKVKYIDWGHTVNDSTGTWIQVVWHRIPIPNSCTKRPLLISNLLSRCYALVILADFSCKFSISFPRACYCVLVSPSPRESFWGPLPQPPDAHATQEALCASTLYILFFFLNKPFIFMMTQARGEVPVITLRESGQRWLEL